MITNEDQLLVCGCNTDGELGIGNNQSLSKPLLNDLLSDYVDLVACGTSHTLVLTKNNRLYSFGNNAKGQLGLGDVNTAKQSTSSNVPVYVQGYDRTKKIIKLCAGSFSGFTDEIGRLFLWGFGNEEFKVPQYQEFDERIIDLALWRDNCIIFDEFGNVLTFENQKVAHSTNEIENCFNQLIEGKNMSKIACGTNYYMCLPEQHLTGNYESIQSMENNCSNPSDNDAVTQTFYRDSNFDRDQVIIEKLNTKALSEAQNTSKVIPQPISSAK